MLQRGHVLAEQLEHGLDEEMRRLRFVSRDALIILK